VSHQEPPEHSDPSKCDADGSIAVNQHQLAPEGCSPLIRSDEQSEAGQVDPANASNIQPDTGEVGALQNVEKPVAQIGDVAPGHLALPYMCDLTLDDVPAHVASASS
jgi:hypothetical protein